jgi:hypothetical protein
MEENLEAITVIDRLGGTSEVARMCDIKPPSVSDWKKYGIPKPWRKFLLCQHPEAFTIVSPPAKAG